MLNLTHMPAGVRAVGRREAIGGHGLIFVINQLLEHLVVMHAGGCGAGFEDELGFKSALTWFFQP